MHRTRDSFFFSFVAYLAVILFVASPFHLAAQDIITFNIDMRFQMRDSIFIPALHRVGVRGNLAPLRWDSTLVATDPDGDSIYSVTVRFSESKRRYYEETRVAYKFKIDGDNVFNRGWEISNNSTLNLTGGSQSVQRYFGVAEQTPAFATMSANVRRHESFPSSILRGRSLYVLLPNDYASSGNRRYPVLYMHDGQNMFDDSTAANGEWHLDEVAEGLMNNKLIPEMIIVGVGTTGEHRIEEYTPTTIVRPSVQGDSIRLGGRGSLHAKMLVEEIKPFIDSVYRTLRDRSNTALGGSSLGGLITMHTGTQYSHIFGTLLVISPSVWWDNQIILTTVRKSAKTMQRGGSFPRIWLDSGDQEGKEALEGARALNAVLKQTGWKSGKNLFYAEIPNAAHSESAWAERMERILTTMFGKK